MRKGPFLAAIISVLLPLGATFLEAQDDPFEYPVYLVDAYDGDASCWTGMDVHGNYEGSVRVVPRTWLVGPPPSEKSGVTLPPDHWVEVQFRGPIVDGPGDDIRLIELGPVNEQAHIFITDGAGQEYLLGLAKAGGEGTGVDPTEIGFDIAGTDLPFAGRAVRIVGLDYGGEAPGFDVGSVIARIHDECGDVACNPVPVDGALSVSAGSRLSFSPGRLAKEHIIYLSTDPASLGDAPQRQDANNFDPEGLELGRTYYWRVDEVNDTRVWPGRIWSFTSADNIVIDDFEDYDFLSDPSNLDHQTIYDAWRNANVYISEDLNYECSKKSMGFNYYYSGLIYDEALHTFSPAQDWAKAGIEVLELLFHGQPFNSPCQMYVVLNDGIAETIVPYHGDPGDLSTEAWQLWRIELGDFNDLDLSNIESLSIGFCAEAGNPSSFGAGTVYFDNITLYASRCLDEDKIATDFNGDCLVNFPDMQELATTWLETGHNTYTAAEPNAPVAWYKFDGNTDDSAGGGAHGIRRGDPIYANGVYGQSIAFDGYDDSVELTRTVNLFSSIRSGITIAFWQHGLDSPRRTDTLFCSNYAYGVEDPVISANLGCWRAPGEYNWDCGRPWSFNGRLSGDHRYQSEWSGRWNHWAFTKDVASGKMQLFLNGRLYDSRDGSNSPISGVSSFQIGSGWYGGYDGLIDDFRIYDYALSQPEIVHAATNGTGIFDLPLMLPADLNDDNRIDLADFALFADNWLQDRIRP
ncbi:MAG: LamG domain-containing protein [Phycisphaerales bacterium]|nr:MAG: LamG domain-containing protein [Phycisphaerales bacterium]